MTIVSLSSWMKLSQLQLGLSCFQVMVYGKPKGHKCIICICDTWPGVWSMECLWRNVYARLVNHRNWNQVKLKLIRKNLQLGSGYQMINSIHILTAFESMLQTMSHAWFLRLTQAHSREACLKSSSKYVFYIPKWHPEMDLVTYFSLSGDFAH